jgi:hypothetical protein
MVVVMVVASVTAVTRRPPQQGGGGGDGGCGCGCGCGATDVVPRSQVLASPKKSTELTPWSYRRRTRITHFQGGLATTKQRITALNIHFTSDPSHVVVELYEMFALQGFKSTSSVVHDFLTSFFYGKS